MKLLSLSPNDSVAAVMLENEALLYAFFIVLAAVMAHVFARSIMSAVSLNLRFDGDFLQATKSSPNRNIVDDSCHPRSLLA